MTRGVDVIKHRDIKSKMIKAKVLFKHPIVARHVPKTVWYNSQNLKRMLDGYGSIYVKANKGWQGNWVIRIKKLSTYEYELADNEVAKLIHPADLETELEAMMDKKTYIIQQGIDLATYKGCPFDIRMVMQKPYDTWELTLTAAKVASREDAVVTNVSKGAKDYPLNDIILEYDQKQDPMATLKELINLSHQISGILGSSLPFRIIGLDMALDKEGKVWFIEANTRPQCARCILVNDKSSVDKFENAQNIIKRER